MHRRRIGMGEATTSRRLDAACRLFWGNDRRRGGLRWER